MVIYKPAKGNGVYGILGTTLLYNILGVLAIVLVNSYVVSSLLKLFLVLFNIYQVYYILLFTTLKYGIDDEHIYILDIFRKHIISFNDIEAYQNFNGKIKGIRLSGSCSDRFAIGKSFVGKVGTTTMFVTDSENIFYLKCEDTIYAVSPMMQGEFEKAIEKKGVQRMEWEYKWNKYKSLHKDKSFMVPFFITTIINIILTLNPFVLYLMNMLPPTMPLNFDSSFLPLEIGKGKQFAFAQMVYGALNMAIQFCMYYASHFYAKYDRRSANKFIYVSLLISVAFLLIQFRILYAFR